MVLKTYMSNFIFNNDSIYTKNNLDSENQELFYTLSGLEEFVDEEQFPRSTSEDNTFAKKILRKNGTPKHMIRLASNGKLFNPVSIYGMEENKTFLDRICRSNKKFKEVNTKVFDLYIKFLQSKNISWLNNAERESE